MSIKYVIDKDTGMVIVATVKDNYRLNEHSTIIDNPTLADDINLDLPLIYKDGVLRNTQKEDMAECKEICDNRKKAKARKNAKLFAEKNVTNDTMISSSTLINVLHRQLQLLSNDEPVESFKEMMADYERQIDEWQNLQQNIRFC